MATRVAALACRPGSEVGMLCSASCVASLAAQLRQKLEDQWVAAAVTLTLTVTSRHSQMLGPTSVKEFDNAGGTIGRGAGNDWVLPDPAKFVSTRHATIEYVDGVYFLSDTSTNGTFVNEAEEPVVYGSRVALNHGDRIQIGEYELAVTLSPQGAHGAAPVPDAEVSGRRAAAPNPQPGGFGSQSPFFQESPEQHVPPAGNDALAWSPPPPAQPPPSAPNADVSWDPGRSEAADAPDPLEILRDRGDLRDAVPPPQHGQSAWLDSDPMTDHFAPPPANAPAPEAGGLIPEDWDKTTFPRQENDPAPAGPASSGPLPTNWDAPPEPPPAQPPGWNQQQVPPQQRAAPPAAPPPSPRRGEPPPQQRPVGGAGADEAGVLGHILEVAGLDPATAQLAAANPQLAETLGYMLRLFVDGMMEVLRARAEVKEAFRLQHTVMRPVENNPLKFFPDGKQALAALFAKQGSGYLPPIEAVQQAFDDTKAHQMAVMAGMQAAFERLMKQFDPRELQRDFEGGSGGGMFQALNKAKYWDRFVELFGRHMRNSDESFRRLFGEPFAEAYEEQMSRLTNARRRH